MSRFIEQKAFSERLCSVLRDRQIGTSPTRLARAFNACTTTPVTIHAVRKWLVGESIPVQAKLLVLAKMLGVDAQWLRFGGSSEVQIVSAPIDVNEIEMTRLFKGLTPANQNVLLTTARALQEAA